MARAATRGSDAGPRPSQAAFGEQLAHQIGNATLGTEQCAHAFVHLAERATQLADRRIDHPFQTVLQAFQTRRQTHEMLQTLQAAPRIPAGTKGGTA